MSAHPHVADKVTVLPMYFGVTGGLLDSHASSWWTTFDASLHKATKLRFASLTGSVSPRLLLTFQDELRSRYLLKVSRWRMRLLFCFLLLFAVCRAQTPQ